MCVYVIVINAPLHEISMCSRQRVLPHAAVLHVNLINKNKCDDSASDSEIVCECNSMETEPGWVVKWIMCEAEISDEQMVKSADKIEPDWGEIFREFANYDYV